jgi:hypothetical protein
VPEQSSFAAYRLSPAAYRLSPATVPPSCPSANIDTAHTDSMPTLLSVRLQGRAGRPQFDTSGTAVIMTSFSSRGRYVGLASGSEAIESNLASSVLEHLASEICLGTVTSLEGAIEWLRSTFLYIRMRAHPRHYGLPVSASTSDVDERLQAMVAEHLIALARCTCIRMQDPSASENGSSTSASGAGGSASAGWMPASAAELRSHPPRSVRFGPLGPCFILSRNYLRFETLKLFSGIPREAGVAEVLQALCFAKELEGTMVVRREEKKVRGAAAHTLTHRRTI